MTTGTPPRSLVIAGSGIAGLYTALRAVRLLPDTAVTLLSKSALEYSNTWYAQGGIAAVLPPGQCAPSDSWRAHSGDTFQAGASMGNAEAVDALCQGAGARIQSLLAYGVRLDRNDDGALALTREAAHSAPRILHSGGDATGAGIASALIAAVLAEPRITVLDHAFLADVVVHSGRTSGVTLLRNGTTQYLPADAVVLATGGAGQLYEHNTNPEVATADGVAIAWRAGAALADLEFFQFHPTSLDVPGNPLVSEALRGEGAVLLDAVGHRFMADYHADGELAPRDVVSRSIVRHLRERSESRVYLDATRLERGRPGYLAARFPTLARLTSGHGFDWTSGPIPVVPAAHYWMGGVRTDLAARTTVPGLYSVGEAACTGVHGANRLASNSLLEGLVFAERAVASMAAGDIRQPVAGVETNPRRRTSNPNGQGIERFTRGELQRLMWDRAGIIRDRAGLDTAANQLGIWCVPQDTANIRDREDQNLLTAARLLVDAAARRSGSLGAHFRSDSPALPANANANASASANTFARTSA